MPPRKPEMRDEDDAIVDRTPPAKKPANNQPCAGCMKAREQHKNPSAACDSHTTMVKAYVRPAKPGILSVFEDKLPGDEVQLPHWEMELPAMRRILETADERSARVLAAERAAVAELEAKLAGIRGAEESQARARQVARDLADRTRAQRAQPPQR